MPSSRVKHYLWVHLWRCFLERLVFELVDWVKQTAFPNVGRYHPTYWGPERCVEELDSGKRQTYVRGSKWSSLFFARACLALCSRLIPASPGGNCFHLNAASHQKEQPSFSEAAWFIEKSPGPCRWQFLPWPFVPQFAQLWNKAKESIAGNYI